MHQSRARSLSGHWPLWVGTAVAAGIACRAYRRWPRLDLRGRVALVTGGSRGLGAGIAHELLHNGAHVVLCARHEEEVDRAVRHLARSGRVHGRVCDVTDRADVSALVLETERRVGAIDVLVNNAGQMLVGPLQHMTRADFDDAMAVHFGGALNTILAVLPAMRRRRRGHIVNIASMAGLVPVPHMAPYVASKYALVGLSRALQEELGREHIQVTTVYPGPMRTGSPLRARFKGQHQAEFAWFATCAALPFVSTGGMRAARRIVQALRSGQTEVTIGPPARLAQLLDGVAPGLLSNLLAMVERLLPAPDASGTRARTGAESTDALQGTWRLRRTQSAAQKLQHHDS